MSFRRIPTNLDPAPEEVLSAEQLARVERFRWAYQFTAIAEVPLCMRDAERIVDRLRFVKWQRLKGRVSS